MAFTNFYMQSGGSDLNAGSTTANAAAVTVTNASWDVTADTYIGLTGTEFAAVNIGDWASVYLDAATVAVFVGQVTAVGALGVSITLSTTAKYGTKPSAGATGRSCKVSGAWASELVLAAGGLASTTVPASTKVNIKAATYTIVASRTISMVGTTTAPLWFSGYNTTPGDLDTDTTNSLTKPLWSLNATFLLTTSGAHQLWTSISVLGNRTSGVWTMSGAAQKLNRIRCENTSSNVSAGAINGNVSGGLILYSWIKCPTTSTSVSCVLTNNDFHVVGTVFEGSGRSGYDNGANRATLVRCIGFNNTGNGFLGQGGELRLINCTVYNSSSHGIHWNATPSVGSMVVGCLLETCGGYGINNSSGTNTNLVVRTCNDFHSCTSGNENGFGDSPAFFGQTDGSTVVTSATDMTPVVGSNARANGFPGVFENQTYSSFNDIGAVRHADPSGGYSGGVYGG